MSASLRKEITANERKNNYFQRLEDFTEYPQLPIGVDAVRILTLEPARTFLDPIICNLSPAAFSTRPKYVALSYTWGNPYPGEDELHENRPVRLEDRLRNISKTSEHPKLVPIILNNQLFGIPPNLYLILSHLRSPTLTLPLWVDAICINQMDMEERNTQVAMMSFIYTRAIKVVAWLGTRKYDFSVDLARLSEVWKRGQVRHFATTLSSVTTKFRSSPEPNESTFARIAESAYWTRLWIVQELCMPRLLLFAYESSIWAYDDFQQIVTLMTRNHGTTDSLDPMLRLLETRGARLTDTMSLEYLIERFVKSQCTEYRDRVYGLLGLANDISSFSFSSESHSPVDEYIATL